MNQLKPTTLLIAAVLVLLVLVGFMANKLGKTNRTVDQLKAINKEQQDTVVTYKNKYGELVAQKSAVDADLKLLRTTYTDDFSWIKQHLGVQEKAVKGIFKVVTSSSYTGGGILDTLLVEQDIITLGFQEHSPWHDLTANIVLKPFSGPKLNYTFETRDSVTLVPYKQGKDIFVKGINANPYSKIAGLQGILVSKAPRRRPWGIGPSIQIGYDSQIRITPGISIQYSLIRF